MGSRAIKVSDATYALLKKKAEEEGTTIKDIVDQMTASEDIMKYAGSWDISEDELERIRADRKKLWERWNL